MPRGHDAKTYWLSDCQSWHNFDFGRDHPVHGGYKYGDLAIQVGGVSDETVVYG
jgi:hypothetical protein